MEKRIYDGISEGLFTYFGFEIFMKSRKDTRLVQSKLEASNKHYQVWHINPQGVTIQYLERQGNFDELASVTLYGTKEKISKVEKIILEEAKRQK